MKNSYISANNKITASDTLRDKTLAAMHNTHKAKRLAMRPFLTAAVACMALVVAIPAILSIQGSSKHAMPMAEPRAALDSAQNSSEVAPTLESVMEPSSPKVFARKDTLSQDANENGTRMPSVALANELTQAIAEEITLKGDAYLENAIKAGGYDADGLEILKVETLFDKTQNVYFRLTAKTESGEEIVLIVTSVSQGDE